jgi:hypothetical protein
MSKGLLNKPGTNAQLNLRRELTPMKIKGHPGTKGSQNLNATIVPLTVPILMGKSSI